MTYHTTGLTEPAQPYPNKCYLPFMLYPPGMKTNTEGQDFLGRNFNFDVDGDDFVLYLSVPYCRTRCKSCPYFIGLLAESDKDNREDRYVDALVQDIRNWAGFRRWRTGKLRAIYLGGGTGSILKVENLRRIVDTVFDCFQVAEDYEFTLEGNARDFDDVKIDYVVGSRVNRLSLGVQSFQADLLATIGSPHAAADSEKVIRAFQSRGFHNIQLDLMYNMPGHTMDVWRCDLDHMRSIGIEHFTIYLYRIHKDTPQHKLINKGREQAPVANESPMVKAMYREALAIASDMGFEMYMVDHFAKPGCENRYNYWNWKAYVDTLAIGPGSYSFFDGCRLGTNTDIEGYVAASNRGEFKIDTVTDRLDPLTQRERYATLAWLFYEIDLGLYRDRFGTEFMDDFSRQVKRLERLGLIEVEPDRLRMTQLGLEWHTNVILEFFNDKFWNDVDALAEPNWSLNGVMVEVGAYPKEHWLGSNFDVTPVAAPTTAQLPAAE
jgi:oxygen-independent coproporphyrinogen-3 oxidase